MVTLMATSWVGGFKGMMGLLAAYDGLFLAIRGYMIETCLL